MDFENFPRWQNLAKQFLGADFFNDIMESKRGSSFPPVDVYQGNHEVIVAIDLPGVEEFRSVDLRVEGDQLHISGTIPSPYHGFSVTLSERKQGEFHKQVSLGAYVARKYSSVRYRRGVLEVRYPKIKQDVSG